MRNRYADALNIQEGGACNVSGITYTLLEAIKQAREEGGNADHDVACRLICHQLAFLFGVDDVNDNYTELMNECRAYAHAAP